MEAEEAAVAQEQPVLCATPETMPQLLASKNFRERIVAYAAIRQAPEHLHLLLNETIVPALEVALDALLDYPAPLTATHIERLPPLLAHAKAPIRKKAEALLGRVAAHSRDVAAEVLLPALTNKNPRIVERVAATTAALVDPADSSAAPLARTVAPRLAALLSAADPAVKKEAFQLAVNAYCLAPQEVLQQIEDVKPIIKKDLLAEFAKHAPARQPLDFAAHSFDDPDWKVRLAAMTALRDSLIDAESLTVIGILQQRLRDVNLQVVAAAAEAVANGKVRHSEVLRLALQRLKDKKPGLTQLIKNIVQELQPSAGLVAEQLESKNPDVRVGALECLGLLAERSEAVIARVAVLLEDGHPGVRRAAVAFLSACSSADLSGLTAEQAERLRKIGSTAQAVAVPVEKAGPPLASPIAVNAAVPAMPVQGSGQTASPGMRRTPVPPAVSQASPIDHIGFYKRFPALADTDWHKKTCALRAHREDLMREPIFYLLDLINPRESNFNILRAAMDALAVHPGTPGAAGELLPLLVPRAADLKLTPGIVELLRLLPRAPVVSSLLNAAAASKAGRRFIALLELLPVFINGPSESVERFIETCTPSGIRERQAVAEFAAKYRAAACEPQALPDKPPSPVKFKSADENAQHAPIIPEQSGTSEAVRRICTETVDYVSDHSIDRIVVPAVTAPPTDIFTDAVAAHSTSEEVRDAYATAFTPAFLALPAGDAMAALRLLPPAVHAAHSTALISLFIRLNSPAPCFNSLLLFLAAGGHILCAAEAAYLAEHLLEQRMCDEIAMLDRVYPATRLYELFRGFIQSGRLVQSSLRAVRGLLDRYTRLSVRANTTAPASDPLDSALLHAINTNSEFISLVAACAAETRGDGKETSAEHAGTAGSGQEEAPRVASQVSAPEESSSLSNGENSFIVVEEPQNAFLVEELEVPPEENSPGGSDKNDGAAAEALRVTTVCAEGMADSSLPGTAPPTDAEATSPRTVLASAGTIIAIPPAEPAERAPLPPGIEKSLENISISTTPLRKRPHSSTGPSPVQSLINALAQASAATFPGAFSALTALPGDELLPYANTLAGTATILLFDNYNDTAFRTALLDALFELTKSTPFCRALRYETLWSVTNDLVRIIADGTRVADVLINMCLNCTTDILRVYLNMIDRGETILKLIWRHSKHVDYASREEAAAVMKVISSFYEDKAAMLSTADTIVLRVAVLHLRRCCAVYSDGVRCVGGARMARVVAVLVAGGEADEIRKCFE